jgi:hypothetical protein
LTRFVWDKFSKDFLETFLSPYGTVIVNQTVSSEIKEIDLVFLPNNSEIPPQLGLLGKICQTACLFEPYRNPITLGDLSNCLSKRFAVCEDWQREAKRQKRPAEIPKMWIFTPTASHRVLSPFSAHLREDWEEGVYFLSEGLETAVVVIHQLPEIPETLWLRLLGRGGTRRRAIDELEAMSVGEPLKLASLKLLYNLSRNLEALSQKSQDDRRLIMLLEPLYEQEREQAVREGEVIGLQKGEVIGLQKGEAIGLQKGEAKLVIRQIRRRFGEIPQNITDKISKLSPEYLESLGEALLDFQSLTDVSDWLSRK